MCWNFLKPGHPALSWCACLGACRTWGVDSEKRPGKNFAITAQPGVAEPLPNIPKDYEERLVKMDFKKAAESRERILAEWTKRYNGKVEKR